jgi:phosphonate transport system substrate-binding protein
MTGPFRSIAAAAICLALALLAPSVAAETLTLGTIDDEVKKTHKRFQALADYLEPRLAGSGVGAVDASIVITSEDMIGSLRSGEIDVYLDSPLIMALIAREAEIRPFLRRWKDGVAEYHSVLFARRDSGLAALDDLLGRVIAFEEPTSTSGYLLPKTMLVERGYRLVEVEDASAAVPADAIGYLFSDDDNNTAFWVQKGKVAAGALDSSNFAELDEKRPGEVTALARSESLTRQLVAHRRDLAPAIVAALGDALLAMHGSEEGSKVLAAFKTARFDAFPGDPNEELARAERILSALAAAPAR